MTNKNDSFKDFFNQTVFVGDKVASTIKNYRGLTESKVIKITPKGVRVEYKDHSGITKTYLTGQKDVIKMPA